jgi:glycosyltransferase involved in cell wall biosynthesis/SAM-dependent methyltransferase
VIPGAVGDPYYAPPALDICTIIAKNYVAFARVLAKSFREQHPESRCWTLVVDDTEGYLEPSGEPFELVRTADLGIEDFEAMAARYDVLELSTAVKPWLLRHLLHDRGLERLAYLDPDIQVFAPLTEVDSLLDDHEMVLIPHLTEPIPDDGRKPSEADILIAGAYNLGFVALSRRPEVDAVLDWWSERLEHDCVVAPERGIFVDQRWMDLLPGFVDRVAVLRDRGYDVAYWNLHARRLERTPDGGVLAGGAPLRFLHFSGFDPLDPTNLSKHQNRIDLAREPVLAELCRDYAQLVVGEGHREARDWPYTYAKAANGLPLDRITRAAYREAEQEGALTQSVFSERGAGRLLAWLNSPAPRGREQGVTRYLATLQEVHPGLRGAFPDLDGAGGAGLLAWARVHGRHEVPIADALLPGFGGFQAVGQTGVNLAGYFDAVLGVGEAARQLIAALQTQHIEVAPIGVTSSASPREDGLAPETAEPRFPVNLICVNADMVPAFVQQVGADFFEGRHSIGYWWWEVTSFPERWYGSFQYLDEVWAGSRFVAESLAQVSPVPVVRMAPPVEVADPPPLSRGQLGLPEGFVFLYLFDYNSVFERKNPLAVVEAFTRAFEPGEGAALVVKSINHERDPANHALLAGAAAGHSDVHLIEETIPASHRDAMVAACDCFVSLHRSEGFGFTLAEAMYLGRPVIATGYSGNLDYMTAANSWLVDYELVPIGTGRDPYPAEGEWAQPDVEHAGRLMREVFADPAAADRRAKRGQAELRASHSREAVGRAASERLALVNRSQRGVAGASGALVSGELGRAGARIRSGPSIPGQSRFGGLQRRARRLVLRLMKPFTVHQRMIDEELVRSIAAIGDGLAGAHMRLDQLAPRTDDLVDQVDALRFDTGRAVRFFDSFGVAGSELPEQQILPKGALPRAPAEPWTEDYAEAHREFVIRALDDPRILDRFRGEEPLPQEYGVGYDERVVEFPWVLTRDLSGSLLDAGSTLNHPHTLVRVRPRVDTLHVVTLAPEEEAYPFLDVSYLFADLRRLPLRDETYDRVVSMSTLEHVGMDNSYYGAGGERSQDPDAELAAAMRELRRVLKPGGTLFLSVPYGAPDDFGWLRVFSPESLDALIAAFEPESVTRTYFRYDLEGWHHASAEDSAGLRYRDHFSSNGPDPDRAVAARAVACVELRKPGR